MILPSKKLATIASLVGGLAYFSQHYTIDGLRGLRIEPRSLLTSQPSNPAYPSNSTGHFPTWDESPYTANGFPNSNSASSSLSTWLPDLAKTVSTFTASSSHSPSNSPLASSALNGASTNPTVLRAPTLKIASFNVEHFGHHKLDSPFVAETVIKIIKQFDVIALQEICTQQQDLIALLVDRVNQGGYRYDYLIGPRVGRGDNLEQFAFIFNTQTIETDRDQLYTVEDPDNLLLRDPLVGWFRAKQTDTRKAFTFTLINIHINPDKTDSEIRILPELVQSIRRDGRNEDDVILVGDFGTDALSIAQLKQHGYSLTLNGTPTLVNGSTVADNLVLTSRSTDEFIGRAGTLDFLRKSNLSIDQALQVSDHLPVWAEFSIVEGGAY